MTTSLYSVDTGGEFKKGSYTGITVVVVVVVVVGFVSFYITMRVGLLRLSAP